MADLEPGSQEWMDAQTPEQMHQWENVVRDPGDVAAWDELIRLYNEDWLNQGLTTDIHENLAMARVGSALAYMNKGDLGGALFNASLGVVNQYGVMTFLGETTAESLDNAAKEAAFQAIFGMFFGWVERAVPSAWRAFVGLLRREATTAGEASATGKLVVPEIVRATEQTVAGTAAGKPLPGNAIVVFGTTPTEGAFKLRPGVDTLSVSGITARGKSVSEAVSLQLADEYRQMFGVARAAQLRRGDTLAGAFVEDIRAAGFDVLHAPTANVRHARIVEVTGSFDDPESRYLLSLAFDRLGRVK